jgi:hypothetical protein
MNEDQKLRRDGAIQIRSNRDHRICKLDQPQGCIAGRETGIKLLVSYNTTICLDRHIS